MADDLAGMAQRSHGVHLIARMADDLADMAQRSHGVRRQRAGSMELGWFVTPMTMPEAHCFNPSMRVND